MGLALSVVEADVDGDAIELARMTEATRIATEQQESELMRAVFEFLPDGIVVVTFSNHGEIVLVNRQAELITGYSRNELIGKEISLLIPENVRDRHDLHRLRYMENPIVRPMGFTQLSPLRLLNKTGREIPLDIYLGPVMTRAHGVCAIAVLRRPLLAAPAGGP